MARPGRARLGEARQGFKIKIWRFEKW